ncbi:acyl-CoA dehydrogenase family protein, partial [Parvibaculum sp.]
MQPFRFDLCELPGETEGLREEIRAFLAEELKHVPKVTRAQTWSGSDTEFSRKMGAKGWIGMTWPKKYGGHERSFFERYVMLEEMLAAGAPVGAHWIGDRQSGPLLLRFGTEEQRQKILPRVAKGECYFCIGMSEPDSGSDLAATRTRADKVDGGYRVNGTKLWTSGAHTAHYMIALFRTDSAPEAKHSGLTQFLVDLKNTDGITIRPIKDLAGNAHFNEVVFEDAFVPDGMLVGTEGGGWGQVTAELAFERSGPERYLSSFMLMVEMIRELEKRG